MQRSEKRQKQDSSAAKPNIQEYLLPVRSRHGSLEQQFGRVLSCPLPKLKIREQYDWLIESASALQEMATLAQQLQRVQTASPVDRVQLVESLDRPEIDMYLYFQLSSLLGDDVKKCKTQDALLDTIVAGYLLAWRVGSDGKTCFETGMSNYLHSLFLDACKCSQTRCAGVKKCAFWGFLNRCPRYLLRQKLADFASSHTLRIASLSRHGPACDKLPDCCAGDDYRSGSDTEEGSDLGIVDEGDEGDGSFEEESDLDFSTQNQLAPITENLPPVQNENSSSAS